MHAGKREKADEVKPKIIPAETREELLRLQFEDQLYVDTSLRDVWRAKELAQLNGAAFPTASKSYTVPSAAPAARTASARADASSAAAPAAARTARSSRTASSTAAARTARSGKLYWFPEHGGDYC